MCTSQAGEQGEQGRPQVRSVGGPYQTVQKRFGPNANVKPSKDVGQAPSYNHQNCPATGGMQEQPFAVVALRPIAEDQAGVDKKEAAKKREDE